MKFNIELDQRSLTVIATALGKRPYEEVFQTVALIQQQVTRQQQAAHDKAADERDAPSGAPQA